ncbi:MAG TPA: FtsW/RodA/SpoVE family cell cycle protein, partial [Burkholderiales bacterium]|nr:FtsW/RodA/SpoVE family cell cycle protein [Burkholderiales bacterium]
MSSVITAGAVRSAGHARAPWDYWLIGAAAALAALGMVMVYSASVDYAMRTQGHSAYFLWRHVLYLAAGLIVVGVVLRTRVRWWEAAGPLLLVVGLGLLVLVLVPGIGRHINGSSRWLH